MLKHLSVSGCDVSHATGDGLDDQQPSTSIGRQSIRFLLAILVFLLMLQPGNPLPGDLLDSSWAAVVAHGYLQEMHWGSDLVFTYGPLGFITPYLDYAPEVFDRYMAAQALFGLLFASTFWLALHDIKPVQCTTLAVTLLVLGCYLPGDAAWLITVGLSLIVARRISSRRQGMATSFVIVLISLLPSFLPLIKISLLPLWLIWLVAGAFLVRRRGQYREILLHVLLAIALPIVWWHLCGQSFSDIPAYISNGILIAKGYATAMATPPSTSTTDSLGFVALTLAVTVLFVQYRQSARCQPDLVLGVALAVCLTVIFKAAYTRADYLHTPIFSISCAVVLCVAPFHVAPPQADQERTSVEVMRMVFALVAWLAISISTPWGGLWSATLATQSHLFSATRILIVREDIVADLSRRREILNSRVNLPILKQAIGNATVDVFSFEQIAGLANRLNLSPRPVFQSYSAYTSQLAKLNDDFYTSDKAPYWVLFKLQTIDSRLPLEDDSLAVPRILATYESVMTERGFLLMRRKAGRTCNAPVYGPEQNLRIGDMVTLPNKGSSAWWLRSRVKLSALGKVKSLILRSPTLQIAVHTTDGQTRKYRLLPDIAASGFIVSPALRSNNDLLDWWQGSTGRIVDTIRIIPGDGASAQDFDQVLSVSIAEDACHLMSRTAAP